jgi:hypothetical protein
MTLLDQDWTQEQAQGLLDKLNLDGGTPKWKLEHLRKLRDWCSAHGKDSRTIDSQLEFVAYELCYAFQGLGMALKRAKTVEEAGKVIEPYVRRLSAHEGVIDKQRVFPTVETREGHGNQYSSADCYSPRKDVAEYLPRPHSRSARTTKKPSRKAPSRPHLSACLGQPSICNLKRHV